MHQQHTASEDIVGKGEIAHNEQFLLFPQCFLLNQIIVSPFVHIFYIISLFAAELEVPKIGISGKGLNISFYIHTGVIPKSTNPEHIRDNFNIFSFTLSNDCMDKLSNLDTQHHYCWNPSLVS